jgi:hypothetical protein
LKFQERGELPQQGFGLRQRHPVALLQHVEGDRAASGSGRGWLIAGLSRKEFHYE